MPSSSSSKSHPYLSDRSLSSIESWKESSSKAAKSPTLSAATTAAASPSNDKTIDPNVQAYLEMKKALYSKRLS